MVEKMDTEIKTLFQDPPVQYRGTPFWAWNSKLEPEKLAAQLPYFKEMGFGGFIMHARAGLSLPYMSDIFLNRVEQCVDQAVSLGLLPHLYDEDQWPSGFAGGVTVKEHPEYRRRVLHFTSEQIENCYQTIARFDIRLNEDGTLAFYRLLRKEEKAENKEWYAQVVVDEDTIRYNKSAYIDTLNPNAVKQFIALTHEKYKQQLGKEFGNTVQSIFTDEPRAPKRLPLPKALGDGEAVLPWTDRLPDSFHQATGRDLIASLPELVWDLKDHRPSQIRWLFYDHVAELFASSFFDTIGEWCDQAGIRFVGHLMDEFPLRASVDVSGDAMRCYRKMHGPGIDMLCGHYEYTTAKQAQSVVRQMGKPEMLSELYGVIGWDGDFREHKLQGDWQAAMGVTRRVPHLAWSSMKGNGKRDYPQSIFYQSPWYREYPLIENHFARVNVAMTQGKPVCRIGVIHPIESVWLHCGPEDTSKQDRERIDYNWQNLTQWLLFGGYDFDFINESMLPKLCKKAGAPLCVGEASYDVIVVPGCETLRSSTMERLKRFTESGGHLIFMDMLPKYIDAQETVVAHTLNAKVIPFEKEAILNELLDYREIDFQDENGQPLENHLYQLREDQYGRWLFIAQGKKPERENTDSQKICLSLSGWWKAQLYDTLSGEIRDMVAEYDESRTYLVIDAFAHDSFLLRLKAGKTDMVCSVSDKMDGFYGSIMVSDECSITLSEPNVLLLDKAQYRLDDDPWQPEEEILRLNHQCKKKLDWHGGCQPWLMPDEVSGHHISLKFEVNSDTELEKVFLALEGLEKAEIIWNDEPVANKAVGWYTDHDIPIVMLPILKKGVNSLQLRMPFEKKETVEWCYLLGDFGVIVDGCSKKLVRFYEKIEFGDIIPQLLPFYSGAITYHIPFETPMAGKLRVQVPVFNAALLKCVVDESVPQTIAFAPYQAEFAVTQGNHMLQLTAFINRTNTFGPVHHANRELEWVGPDAWKSEGTSWTYEYVLHEEGITQKPILTLEGL